MKQIEKYIKGQRTNGNWNIENQNHSTEEPHITTCRSANAA